MSRSTSSKELIFSLVPTQFANFCTSSAGWLRATRQVVAWALRGGSRSAIELWTSATPNGWEISIMLEELIEAGVGLSDLSVQTIDRRSTRTVMASNEK